jgi:arylsulfatase A-like enzyme
MRAHRNVRNARQLPRTDDRIACRSRVTRLTLLWQLTFLVASVGWSDPVPATLGTTKKPNIVFILADDLGYADLKCYGHPSAQTPNLDRLAAEGTRYTQFYMTGVTCCPSRAGLMTGKFPAEFREYPAVAGYGQAVTVTELLRQAGYATGHFGKWHMGPTQAPGTYGIQVINPIAGNAGRKRQDERGRDARIFDAAIQFIEQNKDRPFYVNVWGHISHFPVDPATNLVAQFNGVTVKDSEFSGYMQKKFAEVRDTGGDVNDGMRRYLADVWSLDAAVGRLLAKLDELGLRDDTLVVFSSDQGPAAVELPKKAERLSPADKAKRLQLQWKMLGYAGELRGGKHGLYEGGVRVPFIIRWPGHVPSGRINDTAVIGGIDWLPTLAGLAGIKINSEDFDGEDVSAIWLGIDRERCQPLFWKTDSVKSPAGVRLGKWKMIYPTGKRGEIELYDLSVDPGERTNVAGQHPEVVKDLSATIQKWTATLPKDYVKVGGDD